MKIECSQQQKQINNNNNNTIKACWILAHKVQIQHILLSFLNCDVCTGVVHTAHKKYEYIA